MAGPSAKDKIDQVIAAVDDAPQVEMRQFSVTISSTGRPGVIALPKDASDAEIAEFCGWILTAVLNTHREERQRGAAGRILIPRGSLPTQ